MSSSAKVRPTTLTVFSPTKPDWYPFSWLDQPMTTARVGDASARREFRAKYSQKFDG